MAEANSFEREYGCSEAEWLRWLPGAVRAQALTLSEGRAAVGIGTGHLRLQWRPLPPRRIALITLPRLQVRFAFEHVEDSARASFMRYFDLYLQRGGG